MPNIQNQEIQAMQNTVAMLKKGVALEPSQSKKQQMKEDISELEFLIEQRLSETSDFADIKLEEDIY